MAIDRKALVAEARRQYASIARHRKDPRFVRVIGQLVRAGLLSHRQIRASAEPVSLDDALWAGQWEPRILELLPAILLKKPKFFSSADALPEDLQAVLSGIRRNEKVEEFRGVPAVRYLRWVPRIGHRNKYPSQIKTYRFSREDMILLHELKDQFPGETEISIIRRALRTLRDRVESDVGARG